ncbi:MAG: ankyrin repeat domain-containing protein [Betaproteobacteria bacterium]|nr:ankyrin repeat domain-containing protein [Betaproteobacteria bacterium]
MIPDVAVPARIPGIRSVLAAAAGVLLNLWLAGGAALAQGPAPAANENDLAVIAAAAKGELDGVARAMRAGGGVKARDAQGRTALLAATYGNHVPVALLLMAAGSDVNAKDNQENSAFLLAGAEGYLDILKLTLRSGADVKSTNRYGGTALIPAAHHGHVEAVKELLKTAVPVDHVNKLGWTALLEAIILGDGGARHTEIVRLLVAAKANVNLADKDGVAPLAHARRRGYAEIARILEAAGAK